MKQLFSILLFLLVLSNLQSQTPFAAVDSFALSVSKSNYDDPDDLAKALCKNLTTDADKARVIFTWLADNMRYDFKAIGKEGPEADSKEEYDEKRIKLAYKKGKGICMDYALVYQTMAKSAGLECEFVTGHARSLRGGWARHAWNAVKIDGQWQLLDVTWGAGHSNDGDQKFEKDFQPGFFCPAPRVFALDHFPTDPKWQLLETPIDRTIFKAQPAFAYGDPVAGITNSEPLGLPLIKDPKGETELRLQIKSPPPVIILKSGGRELKYVRTEQDGWLILKFTPGGREVQVWGGETDRQGTHTSLMGIFVVQ